MSWRSSLVREFVQNWSTSLNGSWAWQSQSTIHGWLSNIQMQLILQLLAHKCIPNLSKVHVLLLIDSSFVALYHSGSIRNHIPKHLVNCDYQQGHFSISQADKLPLIHVAWNYHQLGGVFYIECCCWLFRIEVHWVILILFTIHGSHKHSGTL